MTLAVNKQVAKFRLVTMYIVSSCIEASDELKTEN